MRIVTLDHLAGNAFSYTPPNACSFDVCRANLHAPVPHKTDITVKAGPSAPLVLYAGDAITVPETEEFLDHLVATGQAHAEPVPEEVTAVE